MKATLWLPTVLISGAAIGFFAFDLQPRKVGIEARQGSVAKFRFCARAGQQQCVVDGDTIHFGGNIIRLEDIDTPEIRSSKCASERALGKKAKRRLLSLLNSGPVRAVYTGGRDEDQYGRKLRVIEVDGRSVGDSLVAEGLARRWDGARRSWCR